MKYYIETLYESYAQKFKIDKIYFQQSTDHQDLVIFENAAMGRVMALDGVIQTAENDEFIYHEMLAHVPVIAHGDVKSVLVIGGGDGAILRELVKHQTIEKITQVEIDEKVVEMAKTYFPKHSQGAFDDPRLNLVIDDGFNYIKNCQEQFDIIISDSTDPIGPGEVLFTHDFYQHCHRCLGKNGILVTQNGVPFHQLDEAVETAKEFKTIFSDWHFYSAAVPTYIGGILLFGFASDNVSYRQTHLATLRKRYQKANIKTRYYHPGIHMASFELPLYVLEAIGKSDEE